MPVEFKFDFPRTLAAITYLASKDVPELTTYKLLKLVFFADKYHLVRYGRLITGDRYFALPDGPIPSVIYDLLEQVANKPWSQEAKSLAQNLEVDHRYENARFKAKSRFNANELSRSDMAALDKAIKDYGHMDFPELKAISHAIPAYEKAWKSKPIFRKRAPMEYEDFFEKDAEALAGTKEEMLENFHLRKAFARPR